ncbi:hypothetical protein [Clostridium kluyveri]|uniref:hypothetical protein n=1 Tax=Clostridium kluyveri TaxID=1534 RepID=UPI0022465718|nr:hypothetical protein [Clostridium kluyveri]UZQ52422.1 hypothetical protein OP486_09770 [Clostridium kluyveri]
MKEKIILLEILEKSRKELEEMYFNNWDVYTPFSVYVAINFQTGKIQLTDKKWSTDYNNCIFIKKIGTFNTDMKKSRMNLTVDTKEEFFKELYVNNDRLYKMAVRAIEKYYNQYWDELRQWVDKQFKLIG